MIIGTNRGSRLGFTLIELLVVLSIIVVLVGIALAVGSKVTQDARSQATRDFMLNLETSLAAFGTENEDQLPPDRLRLENDTRTEAVEYLIADAREDTPGNFSRSSATSFKSTGNLLAQMDLIVPGIIDNVASLEGNSVRSAQYTPGFTLENGQTTFQIIEPLDAFSQPIRFAHPAFGSGFGDYWDPDDMSVQGRPSLTFQAGSLATLADPDGSPSGNTELELRRSWRPFDPNDGMRRDDWVGDSDEGSAFGGAGAYFYSSGADQDPGTRADNVYAGQSPQFPLETQGFE